jgi:hypothetical protein
MKVATTATTPHRPADDARQHALTPSRSTRHPFGFVEPTNGRTVSSGPFLRPLMRKRRFSKLHKNIVHNLKLLKCHIDQDFLMELSLSGVMLFFSLLIQTASASLPLGSHRSWDL